MSELFINYMREKGIEPTENDVKHFNFMAKVQMEDELDSLKEQLEQLKQQHLDIRREAILEAVDVCFKEFIRFGKIFGYSSEELAGGVVMKDFLKEHATKIGE